MAKNDPNQHEEDEEYERQQAEAFWQQYRDRVARLESGDLPSTPAEKAQVELLRTLHRLFRLHAWEKLLQIDPVNSEMFGEAWQVHDQVRWPERAMQRDYPQVWAAYMALLDEVEKMGPL